MTVSSTRSLVMGTRGSPLALAQARQFARQLEAAHENLVVEERIIRTTGDKNQISSLPAIGGKGVFTLEIEAALLDGSIDFAVHSLKDLPPDLPEGLTLGCIPRRESADDVLVLHGKHTPRDGTVFEGVFRTRGAVIGTSSLRRRAMILNMWPEVVVRDIRGNIDTRLKKLEDGFDAIILAEAGLKRLKIETPNSIHNLSDYNFVSAPGQGALAVETRCDDNRVLDLLRALEDNATRTEIVAERACMRALNAGCSTPLGARATFLEDGKLYLQAVVLSPDGAQRIEARAEDAPQNATRLGDATRLGETVARQLLEKGAQKLLATHF